MTDRAPPPPSIDAEELLSPSDGAELLRIARACLREHLTTGLPLPGAPHRPRLLLPGRAFVTLYSGGALRGCIGRLEADLPLHRAVGRMAVAAATEDSRFAPLALEELAEARLEISVLSASEPTTPEELELGRHGVMLTRGDRRGLFLPKVPLEAGWDRSRLLAELCRKAELPDGAWRDPQARLERFTVQAFVDP